MARYHLAIALAAQGKVAEAKAELKRALATDAGFPEADAAKSLLARLANSEPQQPEYACLKLCVQ